MKRRLRSWSYQRHVRGRYLMVRHRMPTQLTVEIEQEDDGRWIAEVPALAGVLVYAVTAEEARQLGTTLTPVGAEKAGNREGTIPEYTGGLTTPSLSM